MARIKLKTTEEREAEGKALRDKCPRTSHGEKVFGQGQKRDIVAMIEDSNKDRLENLVPVRHGRMLQSPFAFFRGTAALQAYDLAGTPTSGIIVQACGDCHLANFGGFATPERTMVFDINDFDETYPAPFEWDLKRLAASFVVAGRWRGFSAEDQRRFALEAIASYRKSMRKRSGTTVLEAWYSKITMENLKDIADDPDALDRLERNVEKAEGKGHEQVFNKLTEPTKGLPRIVDQPPLIFHADKKELNEKIAAEFFEIYRDTLPAERRMLFDRYQFVDVALKVVGVGSVGTRCLVALLMASPTDPLFLQIKEARRSVLEPWVKKGAKVKHNGERIVVGQRLMQAASDIFLGWAKGPRQGRDFYVRQLRDMKLSPQLESFNEVTMANFAELCGLGLARAHDKAGDAARIAGYLGNKDTFDEAIADYAVAYADQVERDFATFSAAVRNGKLKSDLSPSDMSTALR